MMPLEQHPYFVQRRCRTGVLAAAEYGRLRSRVGTPSSSFRAGRAASTAAGRCISADAPPRPLTRLRLLFSLCLSGVSCVCAPSSFSPKTLKSVGSKNKTLNHPTDFRIFGKNEAGVKTEDSSDKQTLKSKTKTSQRSW